MTARRTGVLAALLALAIVAPEPARAQDGAETHWIVTFDPGTTPSAQDAAVEQTTGEDDPSRTGPRARDFDATDAEAAALAARPEVTVVERDVPAQAAVTPNDPCFLGPGCPVPGSQSGMRRAGAELAWDVVTGREPDRVVVALIDTGVDPAVSEFDGRLTLVSPSACPQLVGTIDDSQVGSVPGHGTMVAGIVGAAGGNGTGVAGVVPGGVTIRSYKALDSHGGSTAAVVAAAINCAVNDGVDVINLSLTINSDVVAVHDAVTRAVNNGIVVVAAAGNEGNPNHAGRYPALYPEVVAVAATDDAGVRASFSNGGSWVDVAAPGRNIVSTVRQSAGGIGIGSGTSFSTPMVSGTAALVLSRNPTLSVAQVRARLEGSAEPLGVTNLGRGLLDISGSVRFTVPTSPACAVTPGYLLDGWGGVHSLGGAPAFAGGPYWQGWDIARDLATAPGLTGGYVLDGWGGVHPVGGAAPLADGTYWRGWDIARAVARRPDGQGVYKLDGWGGVHLVPTAGAHPTIGPGGPYWQGWDIARDVAVDPTNSTRGFVLDGFGGVHPFGFSTTTAASYYTSGRDTARRLFVLPSGTGGYVLDASGRLHPWTSGANPMPPPIAAATFPLGPGRGVDVRGSAVTVASGFGVPVHTGNVPCIASAIWPGWDIGRSYAAAP